MSIIKDVNLLDMRCLFIGRDYRTGEDGGKIVTKRNADFLKRICKDVDEILKPRAKMSTLFKNYCLNEGYGVTNSMRGEFYELMKSNNYDFVWCDGSCDKTFVKYCYLHQIPSIVFYHNVERSFYSAKALATRNIMDKIFAPYISSIEKYVSKKASYRVLLNERDGEEIDKLYNKKPDLILPTSFDTIDQDYIKSLMKSDEDYLLFVGSNFWANEEGLQFFFSEVAPYINDKVKIVGSICDAFRKKDLPDNVELVGRVDNLDSFYANAKAVISPILSGSGTKTKTVEALRYGKTIIGSKEAMMGVPSQYYSKVSIVCNSASDYISAINNANLTKLNSDSLFTFQSVFSTESLFEKLHNFIETNIRDSGN